MQGKRLPLDVKRRRLLRDWRNQMGGTHSTSSNKHIAHSVTVDTKIDELFGEFYFLKQRREFLKWLVSKKRRNGVHSKNKFF